MSQRGIEYEISYNGRNYLVELEAQLLRPDYEFPRTEFEIDHFEVFDMGAQTESPNLDPPNVTNSLSEYDRNKILDKTLDYLTENNSYFEYD